MSKTVSPEQLEMELNKYLREYIEHIDDLVFETTNKLTKQAKSAVSKESPKRSGDYSKGWTIKTIKNAKTYTQKIWNSKKYRITHLLEFGHKVKRNGQVVGSAKAFPHIRKIENEYVEKFINEIERGARK